MNPRIFQAETMAAALAKVKRELGSQAVILRTRTVKSGGMFGVGSRTNVEITASKDANVLPVRRDDASIRARSGVHRGPAKGVAMHAPAPATIDTHQQSAVQRELQDIKSLVQNLVNERNKGQVDDMPVELRQAYVRLIQNEVAEELAAKFMQQLSTRSRAGRPLGPAAINEFLVQQIARSVTPGCPIQVGDGSGRCKVVALVGATGVGKTTTIAKLAADFRLKQNKKVALVTIDTYRIAAVEQLRTYAKIIDVPLEVVLTPDELRQALDRLRDYDIVLIDTAGRSQFDMLKLNELKGFLEAASPDETHLVLSANCGKLAMFKALESFSDVGANRVIFTKVDEGVGMGTLLAVIHKMDAQLSYITTGQDVPQDIEVGDGRRLAEMIICGSYSRDN